MGWSDVSLPPSPPPSTQNVVLANTMPTFVDVWPAVKPPSDKGFTFDSFINKNLEHPRQDEQVRS